MVRAAIPDGPGDGECGPVGPRLHPFALQLRLRGARHHGDADDLDDKERLTTILIAPLTDLLGAVAGLCHRDRRGDSRSQRCCRASGCRGWCCSASMCSGSSARSCRAVAAPDGDQGRDVGLHDGDAQIPDAPRRATCARVVAARDDLPQARRHHHRATVAILWVLGQLSGGAGRAVKQSEYSIAGRIASGHRGRGQADRLQPRYRARAAARHGRARGSGGGDRHRLCGRQSRRRGGQETITENLRARWSLPTALAFLMWFVFAPQCISTIAVTRRETNGWKWPLFMIGYLFALAYVAAGRLIGARWRWGSSARLAM
jgi:hypothetical protein